MEADITVHESPFMVCLGVSKQERERPQKILVDATVTTDIGEAARTDLLEHTIDSRKIHNKVSEICLCKEYKLIETLVVELVKGLLTIEGVRNVVVTVHKIGALQDTNCKGVSVTASSIR